MVYGMDIEWSGPGNEFAGPAVDTAREVRWTLRCRSGDRRVDLTPRRLSGFVLRPEERVRWGNVSAARNEVVAEGYLTVDSDGLLTVPGFLVSPAGNTLVLRRAPQNGAR